MSNIVIIPTYKEKENIEAMITAISVPWCLAFFGAALGWKLAFILTGAIGFIWLIFY